ncbi:MAG: FMN-binding negative transcriptional regulator [Reyranellaceae bacterium]
MYVPGHFAINDPATMIGFMRANSFALLTSCTDEGPFVSHLPLLHVEGGGPHGRLVGHMARANPQWRHFASGKPALVVFWGPHAYISPSWYETANQVPTWNYQTVHAYGLPRIVEPQHEVLETLRSLVDTFESGFDAPWRMDSLPAGQAAAMTRGIVAFEIVIDRLEGKAKLSQNKTQTDRERAAAMLEALGGEDNVRTAALMRATI